MHASRRSIHYPLLDHSPQCAISRRVVHYVAPDQIRSVYVGCNPVAVAERSDFNQVGGRAYHRQSTATSGEWAKTEPVLAAPQDLPGLIVGWTALPSPEPSAGGAFSITAFHIPAFTTIVLNGSEQLAVRLPIEIQRYPRVRFPGDPVTRGGSRVSIRYRGEHHRPERMVEEGQLWIEPRTARPLRYVSRVTATIGDDVEVVLGRTHVRFRYPTEIDSIVIPVDVN